MSSFANNSTYKIAIIGSGLMGTGLAQLWSVAGYNVVIGSRNPEATINSIPPKSSLNTITEAIKNASVIVLCIPHYALEPLILHHYNMFDSKIVIDVVNSVAVSNQKEFYSTLGSRLSHGKWLQNLLPNAHVIRAFNHIQAELLVSRATRQPQFWGVAVASDYAIPTWALQLIEDTGYIPVNFGHLQKSILTEPGQPLFPRLYTAKELTDLVSDSKYQEKCN